MASTSPQATARRNTELGLVVMAAAITAIAYTLAALGTNSQIPARIIPFLVALLGLLLSAHVANRVLAPGADSTLLPLAVLLNGVGYVVIARLSTRLAGLQTTWTFIAIAAFAAVLLFVQRPADLARFQWTFLFVGAGLLMLPLVPGLGTSVGGARIWVHLGPVNFQQPIVYGAFNVDDNFEPGFQIPWGAPIYVADMQGGMNRVRMPDGSLNHFTAVLGPTFSTPGTLSTVSPIRVR